MKNFEQADEYNTYITPMSIEMSKLIILSPKTHQRLYGYTGCTEILADLTNQDPKISETIKLIIKSEYSVFPFGIFEW